MFNVWSLAPSVATASLHMRQGGVIAYPTEAVWGLGCDPFNESAVLNLLSLKIRDVEKGLILIAGDTSEVDFLIRDLNDEQRKKLKGTWPGPNTWIIPNNGSVPQWVTGEHSGVAVRVTEHPYVKALCKKFGGPIISTSANPQGEEPARTRSEVARYFQSAPKLNYITQGKVGKQEKPSTIRDINSDKVLRS